MNSCCTALILFLNAPLYSPPFLCSGALLLIMFPMSVGSRPATGHTDVVVDNWTLSTVEDYECVVILSRWRPALGDYSSPPEGRREGLTVGCLILLSYRAWYIITARLYQGERSLSGDSSKEHECGSLMLSSFLFPIQLVSRFPSEQQSPSFFIFCILTQNLIFAIPAHWLCIVFRGSCLITNPLQPQ